MQQLQTSLWSLAAPVAAVPPLTPHQHLVGPPLRVGGGQAAACDQQLTQLSQLAQLSQLQMLAADPQQLQQQLLYLQYPELLTSQLAMPNQTLSSSYSLPYLQALSSLGRFCKFIHCLFIIFRTGFCLPSSGLQQSNSSLLQSLYLPPPAPSVGLTLQDQLMSDYRLVSSSSPAATIPAKSGVQTKKNKKNIKFIFKQVIFIFPAESMIPWSLNFFTSQSNISARSKPLAKRLADRFYPCQQARRKTSCDTRL